MYTSHKTAQTVAALALALGMGSAQAALWNFTLTGEVVYADEPNDYNLSGQTVDPMNPPYGIPGSGSPVTVTGIFDDAVLSGGTGTIDFSIGNFYGNDFTVTAGAVTFTPGEVFSGTPSLLLDSMNIDYANGGFSFYATDIDTGATFNAYFDAFDGDDANYMLISGMWTDFSVTPVPVPAAVWLFGSGLLGLVGIARRKSAA